MTQIILELPDFYAQKLENKAMINQKTIQEVLADMIRRFIDTEETKNKTESRSCLELAKDLAGCLEDEKDLSANKKEARKSGKGELPEWLINDMKENLYVCNNKNIR